MDNRIQNLLAFASGSAAASEACHALSAREKGAIFHPAALVFEAGSAATLIYSLALLIFPKMKASQIGALSLLGATVAILPTIKLGEGE